MIFLPVMVHSGAVSLDSTNICMKDSTLNEDLSATPFYIDITSTGVISKDVYTYNDFERVPNECIYEENNYDSWAGKTVLMSIVKFEDFDSQIVSTGNIVVPDCVSLTADDDIGFVTLNIEETCYTDGGLFTQSGHYQIVGDMSMSFAYPDGHQQDDSLEFNVVLDVVGACDSS